METQKAPGEAALGGGVLSDMSGQSGAERLPTACAAGVQDFAAGFGGHARTETVAALAHEVRRLERAFGHLSRSEFGWPEGTECAPRTAWKLLKPGQ